MTQNKIFLSIFFLLLVNLSCSNNAVNFTSNNLIGVLYDGTNVQMEAAQRAAAAAGLPDPTNNLKFLKTQSPSDIKTNIATLLSQGVHIFVGANTSVEAVQALTSLKNSTAVIISPSSTDPLLNSAGDGLMRLAPPDNNQAAVLAKVMQDAGVQCVFSLYRDDIYGRGLTQYFQKSAQGLSMKFPNTYRYSYAVDALTAKPQASVIQAQVATLGTAISNSGCDLAKTALQVIAFDEITMILDAAESIPVFKSIKWFGSDGFAGSSALTQDARASVFANTVKLLAPNFSVSAAKSDQPSLEAALKTYLVWYCSMQTPAPDRQISIYDGNFYDAVTLATKTLLLENGASINLSKFETDLLATAASTTGVTGPLTLDANGDRATSNYDFYGIDLTPTQWAGKLGACSADTPTTCVLGTISRPVDIPVSKVCL